MKGQERIATVLNGGMPDRVTYFDFFMSQRFIKFLTGVTPSLYRSEHVDKCCKKAWIDAAWIPVRGFMGCEYDKEAGIDYTDEFGVSFRRTSISWPVNAPVKNIILDSSDMKNFSFPETGRSWTTDIVEAVKQANGETAVFAAIQGPLRTA